MSSRIDVESLLRENPSGQGRMNVEDNERGRPNAQLIQSEMVLDHVAENFNNKTPPPESPPSNINPVELSSVNRDTSTLQGYGLRGTANTIGGVRIRMEESAKRGVPIEEETDKIYAAKSRKQAAKRREAVPKPPPNRPAYPSSPGSPRSHRSLLITALEREIERQSIARADQATAKTQTAGNSQQVAARPLALTIPEAVAAANAQRHAEQAPTAATQDAPRSPLPESTQQQTRNQQQNTTQPPPQTTREAILATDTQGERERATAAPPGSTSTPLPQSPQQESTSQPPLVATREAIVASNSEGQVVQGSSAKAKRHPRTPLPHSSQQLASVQPTPSNVAHGVPTTAQYLMQQGQQQQQKGTQQSQISSDAETLQRTPVSSVAQQQLTVQSSVSAVPAGTPELVAQHQVSTTAPRGLHWWVVSEIARVGGHPRELALVWSIGTQRQPTQQEIESIRNGPLSYLTDDGVRAYIIWHCEYIQALYRRGPMQQSQVSITPQGMQTSAVSQAAQQQPLAQRIPADTQVDTANLQTWNGGLANQTNLQSHGPLPCSNEPPHKKQKVADAVPEHHKPPVSTVHPHQPCLIACDAIMRMKNPLIAMDTRFASLDLLLKECYEYQHQGSLTVNLHQHVAYMANELETTVLRYMKSFPLQEMVTGAGKDQFVRQMSVELLVEVLKEFKNELEAYSKMRAAAQKICGLQQWDLK